MIFLLITKATVCFLNSIVYFFSLANLNKKKSYWSNWLESSILSLNQKWDILVDNFFYFFFLLNRRCTSWWATLVPIESEEQRRNAELHSEAEQCRKSWTIGAGVESRCGTCRRHLADFVSSADDEGRQQTSSGP